jgi:hypothetical protein
MERSQYFLDVQLKERERIHHLFNNYNFNQYLLAVTDPNSNADFDFYYLSARTRNVFGEFKRRAIHSTLYSTSFIEMEKFEKLWSLHKAGNYTLFCVEYDDYYFAWDLCYQYFLREYTEPYLFYCELDATADMYDYSKGSKQKLIKNLEFYDAKFIITKDFRRITYQEFLTNISV